MIAFEEYIDLLSQLIAVPAFSREEGPACDVMEAWMRSGSNIPFAGTATT